MCLHPFLVLDKLFLTETESDKPPNFARPSQNPTLCVDFQGQGVNQLERRVAVDYARVEGSRYINVQVAGDEIVGDCFPLTYVFQNLV